MHDGWGQGSCFINAAIQVVFSASTVRATLARLLADSARRMTPDKQELGYIRDQADLRRAERRSSHVDD